jgi:spore coat protein U-like protein
MRKIAVTAALAAALAATPSLAAQKTADMEVTLNVLNNCTLTTPAALDFGTVTDISTATATGTATVNCTLDAEYTLAISQGNHENAGSRRMANADSSAFVPYYINLAGSTAPATGTGTGSAQNYGLEGVLQPAGPVPAGSYSDLVVVSLTY